MHIQNFCEGHHLLEDSHLQDQGKEKRTAEIDVKRQSLTLRLFKKSTKVVQQ